MNTWTYFAPQAKQLKYYSFKILCRFWLAPIPRLILHNHMQIGIVDSYEVW